MNDTTPEPSLRPSVDRQCYGVAELRGICEDCDWIVVCNAMGWKDVRDARSKIRTHVADTEHVVAVEVTSQEVYRVG